MNKYRLRAIGILVAITLASCGEWIYLIALNLKVYQQAEQAAVAVAVLYMIKPAAGLLMNSWAGSFIDRMDNRKLMIGLYFIRVIGITGMMLTDSLGQIYLLVFLVAAAGSIFEPASLPYITGLIQKRHWQRFNSFRAIAEGSGFVLGPAVAGILVGLGSVDMALLVNSFFLLLAAGICLMLPSIKIPIEKASGQRWLQIWREDWELVTAFSKKFAALTLLLLLFSCITIMTAAVDSMEVAFASEAIGLSEAAYGVLVSIAGSGFIIGSILLSMVTQYFQAVQLLCYGSAAGAIGYVVFSFSNSFLSAGVGVFILSAALAFANAGYLTYMQEHIPENQLGRMMSMYQTIESVLIIGMTAVLAGINAMTDVAVAVQIGCFIMLLLAVVLFYFSKRKGLTS
ncbi:MFS-type transporter involved in bile tolerance, Atg22 family [Terribacillus aidingensis]|uniref:MFS-type transporter involved in bile tolerance, Atg22 family n=1 Tax=Terribacillus aidingensis TaxID=586416 RepID=A0A285P7V1_9BACI|nr:MFS transporter [Terribacillus aidingensis]SNZ17337.1 MFS-type transporter involved in bile tolerance, Atg22 family [Terribacillus aidingensis]